MARRQQLLWHDIAIILLIILVLATNAYWMVIQRDTNERLDAQAAAIVQLQK